MSDELATGFIDQSSGKSNSSDIDFGALRTQAETMLNDIDAARSPEPISTETPAPEAVAADPTDVRVKSAETPGHVPDAAPVADPVEIQDASQAQLASLPDDTLVSVPVDGKDQVMTWKEAKAGFSRTAHYTQSMQKLAADRTAFAAERTRLEQLSAERVVLESFLKNKNAILKYVQNEFGVQPSADPAEPVPGADEIVTYGEAQAIAARQAQEFQARIDAVTQNVEARIRASTQEIERDKAIAGHQVAIQSTLKDIFTSSPVLNAIPNAEDVLRFEVSKLNPTTEAEALAAFHQVAKGMVEDIAQHHIASRKIQVVTAAKQKLVSKTIEPAGGSAPQITPTSYKSADGSVDWKRVTQLAKDFGAA